MYWASEKKNKIQKIIATLWMKNKKSENSEKLSIEEFSLRSLMYVFLFFLKFFSVGTFFSRFGMLLNLVFSSSFEKKNEMKIPSFYYTILSRGKFLNIFLLKLFFFVFLVCKIKKEKLFVWILIDFSCFCFTWISIIKYHWGLYFAIH